MLKGVMVNAVLHNVNEGRRATALWRMMSYRKAMGRSWV